MNSRATNLALIILIGVLVGGAVLAATYGGTPGGIGSTAQPQQPVSHASVGGQNRPDLGGRELTYGTEHFLVHYTDEGENAMPAIDENGNGIPDYVERVASGMEAAWVFQMNTIGFAPPPTDAGIGGDERFDIYLLYISYFGYADSAGGFITDNPYTAQREQRAAFSYMALDNTFSAYAKFGITTGQALDITSAHEFNHSVQYGYDANEELWLLESTATLVEELNYPDVNDNIGYLIAHADAPDQCLAMTTPFYHPYSHWYFLKYIVEQHPLGVKFLPRLWDFARDRDGLFALDAALNGELNHYWGNWVVANLARQNCPLGAPYCMAEGELYPPVHIEGRLSPLGWNGSLVYQPPDGVGSYGVDYIDLTPLASTRVALDLAVAGKTPGVNYTARLVGFGNSPTPSITQVPLENGVGTIRIHPTEFKQLYLTVENRTPALEANCGRAQGDYSVMLTRVGEFGSLDAVRLSAPPIIRPGEMFTATLNLQSLIQDESKAIITLTLPDGIELQSASFPGGAVSLDGQTVQSNGALGTQPATATLTLRLIDSAPPATYEVRGTANGATAASTVTFSASLIAPQPLLLVDDAAEADSLTAALDAIGFAYDVWLTADRGSPTAEMLANYPSVIWTTDRGSVQTLIDEDRAALRQYVEQGGRLTLMGSDWAYELWIAGTDDSRRFLNDTLGAKFSAERFQTKAGSVALGTAAGNTLTLNFSDDDISDDTMPDVLMAAAGKTRVWLAYPDGRAAALQSLNGRVTVLSFDLTQLAEADQVVLLRWLYSP